MLDKFLEVAYSREKTASNNRELVELLQKLPADELVRVASGTSELNKVAYCSPCGDGSWLDRFKGSPLFEQALAIEQQLLELEMAEAEKREGDQATWNARDKLNVQKRMLDLQLAQQGNGGEAPVLAPSVEQPELGQEPAAPAAPAPAPSRVEVKTAAEKSEVYRDVAKKFPELAARSDVQETKKAAMLGIGIDVASFGESDKMKGTLNIGFPHGVSLNARHKPTGLGAGIGMSGVPVISWSPSTMSEYEKSKKLKTAAVYAERFKAALAKEAALPKALVDRARSIKDVAATKSPLTEVSFKSLLGKGTSSGPGRELAFKSLAKKAALSKEAIGFMGAAKGLLNVAKRGYGAGGLSGAAQGAGKYFGAVAKKNPLAAAGLVAAPVAAAGLGAGALAGRASA